MNKTAAVELVRAKIRLKHMAYTTEQAYCGWPALRAFSRTTGSPARCRRSPSRSATPCRAASPAPSWPPQSVRIRTSAFSKP